MNEMDTPFSCEYTYDRRAEGVRLAIRLAVIFCYVLFVAAFFLVVYFTRLIPLFALCPVALWIIIYFTWPYLNFDYYFEFRAGVLVLGTERKRRRGRKRSPKLEIRVKDAEKICPIPAGRVKLSGVHKCYDYSGTKRSDKRLEIVYASNGKRCAAILECTPALAKMLRSYSRNSEELTDFI